MVFLPAAAERFVEGDELLCRCLLGDDVLLLQVELLALGVDDVEHVCQPAIIALCGEAEGLLAGGESAIQVLQAIGLRRIGAGSRIDVFHR